MTTPFICHVEWGTPDREVLRSFLADLFGREFQTLEPGYLIHRAADGAPSIGINQSDQLRAGGSPTASVRVSDLDAMLARAGSLGCFVDTAATR